jgi:penicillin-binding protein 1A
LSAEEDAVKKEQIVEFLKKAVRPSRGQLVVSLIFAAPVILGVVAGLTVAGHLNETLPSLEQLENIEPRLITKLYDKENDLAHEFFVEKRIWTPIDSTPEVVWRAIMAIEDRKFFNHWGMNLWAIPSALLEAAQGKKLRGASTLTQQLTKNLFLTPERSLTRKLKEALTAIRLEQTYTKEEILEFYLNTVYLGGGNYGFQAACQNYFGHSLDSITTGEAATLAGMLQRPEAYRPDRHPERGRLRRNTVLYAMHDAGYISREESLSSQEEPMFVQAQEKKSSVGGYFIEEVRKYLERKYGENSLYADGVQVYTTMDQDLQAFAEEAVRKQLVEVRAKLKRRHTWKLGLHKKYNMPVDSVVAHFDSIYALFSKEYLSKDPDKKKYPDTNRYHLAQAAAVLIENSTGAIRAIVGGEDFEKYKFNRAMQSYRQPGSAFKPFVYATAMDNGASPSDSMDDQPITIKDPTDPSKTWRPANYTKKFEGNISIRKALYLSKNLPAIKVGLKYGLPNVIHYARKFGIKSRLEAVPSLALGSIGATLLEMTSAYSTFANGGTRLEPYFIEEMMDKRGEIIEKSFRVEHEVLRPGPNSLMVSMLKDVNTRGTAAKVWSSGFHHPSGGKTGTTNDYTDAWYIGFTKQYTMGVWVGTDAHVKMGYGHTGGQDALPIWIEVMKEAHKELPVENFEYPGIRGVKVCNHTGKIAGPYCAHTTHCLFSSGNGPREQCDGNHLQERQTEGAEIFSDTKRNGQKRGMTF